MARQWKITSQEGWEKSLTYEVDVRVPSAEELGDMQVLVKLHAASLNYRELMIPAVNSYHGPLTGPVVPGCDGAGEVEAIGAGVTEFKVGDRVVTHLAPAPAIEKGDDAPVGLSDALGGLGQGLDGVLRSMGVFHEKALSPAPKSIGWLAASTLTCTWSTAWNVLFGVKGQEVSKDSWILVEGTGGASIAVLQIAVAAGATVVATTSSEEKAARLKTLGASHVVNYRISTDWGVEARKLTPEGRGFDLCVDIGGNETLPQALAAVRTDGFLYVLGGVGAQADPVPLTSVTLHTCTARGILGGSRSHLAAVVKFIDEKGIQPAVDDVVFELADAKQACRRLEERKHFSKVIIRIDHFEQE